MNVFLVAALIVLAVYTAVRDLKQRRESARLLSRLWDKKEAFRQGTADVIPFQQRELTIRKRRALRQRVTSINPRPYRGGSAA